MLTAKDGLLRHRLQDLQLISLSIVFLPLNTLALLLTYPVNAYRQHAALSTRTARLADPQWRPRTILVTGVGMTKGLELARLFYQAGHTVIGADFESNGTLVCGRVSKSLQKFCSLRKPTTQAGCEPYLEDLLNIIITEKIDLWVSCSGVASALEDGRAKERIEEKTKCKAIQFDVATTQLLHEKDSFIQHVHELGLTVPQTHKVVSRDAALDVLEQARQGEKHRFLLKPIGVQDADRADMTLLPRASKAETLDYLSTKHFSEKSSWILQQYLDGPEYCTHSLVVRGEVKAFVACPSAELLMHYEALPRDSKLYKAMLDFTETVAAHHGRDFTGHLSFDFMTDAHTSDVDGSPTLYPIECNPRAHTAVVLFRDQLELANAYLTILDSEKGANGSTAQQALSSNIVAPEGKKKYYWIGHDLVELILFPILSLLTEGQRSRNTSPQPSRFLDHLLSWHDGTYTPWDPAPWWWLYQVYWPTVFLRAFLSGKKWSRINVSTTKMFEC